MLRLDLQLFAEGAGEGSGAEGQAQGGLNTDGGANGTRGEKNPLRDVVYGTPDGSGDGKQGEVQQPRKQEPDAKAVEAERKRAFDGLIYGDYKDLYQKNVESLLQKRFKGHMETQARYDEARPVLDILMDKYGTRDVAKLREALENDNDFFEEEAVKRGVTPDQYKQLRRLESENRQFREAEQQARAAAEAQKISDGWMAEAEAVKAKYPTFDFLAECNNPEFVSLLQSNVGVETAFIALHRDEIIGGALAYTAQTVQRQTLDTIRAGAARPIENGVSQNAGITVKSDVSKLTAADRKEIARRVERGEWITF